MYVARMVFCGIICKIFLSRLIEEAEHTLGFLIQQPKISHFHGAGFLPLDSVVDNPNGSGVVNVYWGWWLGVPEFLEGEADDLGFLCVEEQGTKLSLGS